MTATPQPKKRQKSPQTLKYEKMLEALPDDALAEQDPEPWGGPVIRAQAARFRKLMAENNGQEG